MLKNILYNNKLFHKNKDKIIIDKSLLYYHYYLLNMYFI